MKQHTVLPILLLGLTAALAAPASAQSLPYATVATAPANPAPGDPVVLKLSGQWPDGCVPDDSLASLSRSGTALRVHFNYAGFAGACTAAVTPWSLDVPAGPLAAGNYTVEVTLARSLMPSQTIGTGSFTVAAPAEATFWLPGFLSRGEAVSLASTLTAYNNSDSSTTVTTLGIFDALGERAATAGPTTLAPHASAILDTRNLRPGQAVQMIAFRAARRASFRATLERLETVPEGLPKVPESLGRVELPIFTELVPAGMTAVAGDVSLSALECASGPEARRRVNLTIFNSGSKSATFQVSATGTNLGPGGSVTDLTYTVPARSLVQFNALSLDTLPVCEPGGGWFRITGDQPFLAYISTVRPETIPGLLPYEIFPARVDR